MLSDHYLDLVKSVLLNEAYIELEAQLLFAVLCAAENTTMDLQDFWAVRDDAAFLSQLREAKAGGDSVILETRSAGGPRADGSLRNFTEFSYTLVGRKRLDHLQACVESVLNENIPGDFLEAGAWRGGCCILMRAVLAAHEVTDRRVWVADSFEGLPASRHEADRPYEMDAGRLPVLAVSESAARENFRRFKLLDDQVRFLPGWFKDTLPGAATGALALLRIDCDLYESTRTVLEQLYARVSPGGWVVIDDYGMLPPCKQAVDEFRANRGIRAEMQAIDAHAVCWRVE